MKNVIGTSGAIGAENPHHVAELDPAAAPWSEGIEAALRAARSPSTIDTYYHGWQSWLTWAETTGASVSPARPECVMAWLVTLADQGKKPNTLRSYLRGLRWHQTGLASPDGQLLPNPAEHPRVRQTLSGLIRQAGHRDKQASPLTFDDICLIRKTATRHRRRRGRGVETGEQATARGLMDIAIASVMWNALLRRSEAAALTWGDISDDGVDGGRLLIRRSKTDQDGNGHMLWLSPVTMADLNAIRPQDAKPDDAVFRTRMGEPMSAGTIVRRLKQAAQAAGIGEKISGHSPRVGAAQDLTASGASITELMAAGRWRNPAEAARYAERTAVGRGAMAKFHHAHAGSSE